MRSPRRVAGCLLALLLTAPLILAQTVVPDLSRIADPAVWQVVGRLAAVASEGTRHAVQLDAKSGEGVAWLVGSDFAAGTIEVDLRGRYAPGQSFVGIAFRGLDATTYDAVYFRPFNFRSPEPARRAHAVQYISMPKFNWPKLRDQHPGKFEAAVSPVPEPDEWFHARIVVEGRTVSVFVNGSATPSLVVSELSERRGGRIGLWTGNGSDGAFANLQITAQP